MEKTLIKLGNWVTDFKLDCWVDCVKVIILNSRNAVPPCVQIKKMSSMYLFQMRGCRLFGALLNAVSSKYSV